MSSFHFNAEDCIHLKACRRLTKICKGKGFSFARGCDAETCDAYESDVSDYIVDDGSFVTTDDAMEYARSVLYDLQYGCSPDDLCLSGDIDGRTLRELYEEYNK